MNRLVGAIAILGALIVIEAISPQGFPIVVGAVLIGSTVICWAATLLLGNAHDYDRDEAEHGGPEASRLLEAAFYAALLLAIASTVGALLGLFAILRVANIIAPNPQVFLIGIAWVMVLIPGPAIELLRVFRK